jgi:hypothetical protein
MLYMHKYVTMHGVAGYAFEVTLISMSLPKEEHVAYFNNTCIRKIRNPQKISR